MITLEQLAADKASIELAQKKLIEDQESYDAALPHLSVINELSVFANNLSSDVVDSFNAVIAKAKALL